MRIALSSFSNEISHWDMILFCTLWKDWQVPYLDMSVWEVSVGTGKKNDTLTIAFFSFYILLHKTMLPFLSVTTLCKVIRAYATCQPVFRSSTKK